MSAWLVALLAGMAVAALVPPAGPVLRRPGRPRQGWSVPVPVLARRRRVAADQAAVLARIEQDYAARDGVTLDHLDGLTVSHADWWFNVRASNTEPLLRLNAEGKDEATMTAVRDAVLTTIRST